MGTILTIAKRDIKGYLTAPKAAAIFWFFLLLTGFFFHNFVYTFVEMQQRGGPSGGAPGLDQLLMALFQNIHFILLLIMPAITMASFSEEKRTHAFRLLQSAPISATQIVLGKFLAVAGIVAIVMICSSVYPFFTRAYGNPDVGVILTSYLGLFLLMCSQLAFGLWISSMTTSQFMAFLFTMFGIFLLLILSWIARNITGGGIAEAVVKYLSSTTHLESFLKGMITVQDVTYFLCFTALFLFFTNIVVDSQRWR